MSHIIQITTFFHPVHGGVEQHVEDLSNELIKQGHEVTVFCSNSTFTKEKVKDAQDKLGKINIRRFNTWFGLSQFYKVYPSLFFALLKTNYDIVHVHTFRRFEIFVALLAAKLKRKKIFLTTHNPFTANTRSLFLQIFVFLNDQILGKLFLRFVDKVICLLDEEINILKKYHISQERIHVIPNGISDDAFKQGRRKKFIEKHNIPAEDFKYKVLWIGRINKVKGLENLETVVKQIKDALFMFVGPDADASQEVKAIYEGCKNVVFTGPIKHEEIINAYNAANLFVLPSIHEPFGIVLLEAMAQGVPIVATNVGGPKQIIKESFGITQDPKDQWAWMLNIEKLLKNRKLRKQMGINAREEAEKYRWSNLIYQVLETYDI